MLKGEIDPLEFHVAETLGVPLYVVRQLPNSELEEWRAWYQVKAQKMELEEMKARQRRGR